MTYKIALILPVILSLGLSAASFAQFRTTAQVVEAAEEREEADVDTALTSEIRARMDEEENPASTDEDPRHRRRVLEDNPEEHEFQFGARALGGYFAGGSEQP